MKAKTQGTCRRGQTLLDFWLRTKPLRIASRCHSVTPTPRAGISQAQNFHGCYYFLPTDPGLFTAWLWLAGHGHCQRSSMNQQIANQSSRKVPGYCSAATEPMATPKATMSAMDVRSRQTNMYIFLRAFVLPKKHKF